MAKGAFGADVFLLGTGPIRLSVRFDSDSHVSILYLIESNSTDTSVAAEMVGAAAAA